MFFTVFQKDFYQGIQIVQRAVSSKSTLPITTGIYLEAKKDKGLHLIATNLEIGIEYWIKADIKKEGAIVLPAIQLANIIRELPAADIVFKIDLEHYQVKLNCLNSEFIINGFKPDEFPQLPEVNRPQKIIISTDIIKNMIEEVKFSISIDQNQTSLTGGLMVIDRESIKMVTTNTYRLAYSQFPLKNEIENIIKIILPGNTLNELAYLLNDEGNVEILISTNYVRFNFNEIILISRLIEGSFPNYDQVIPKEYNTKIKADRIELFRAVKRVSLIASLDSNIITMIADKDKLEIKSIDSDSGYASEGLEIELTGPEQKINVDASYLLDVLKVLKEDIITMELIGPLNPLCVKKDQNDNYVYLIMPVRPGI